VCRRGGSRGAATGEQGCHSSAKQSTQVGRCGALYAADRPAQASLIEATPPVIRPPFRHETGSGEPWMHYQNCASKR